MNERIKKALKIAQENGSIDGDHHKMWVIDQIVRALTGCPMVEKTAEDCNCKLYNYEKQGKSDEYKKWVAETCDGEDGPGTYDWDVGIIP